MFILLVVLRILSFNDAYNFTCPSQTQWNIRANYMCNPSKNYICLFDVTYGVNVYREKCRRPRLLAAGYKYVFQPKLNNATCSATRYQPFLFDTIGHSDCTYQKSFCSSLGQEMYEIGNTKVDKTCICNTDRGYAFLRSSKNQCFCNPSIEDCSCYLRINPYNRTDGLKNITCFDEMKIKRSLYFGDIINVSRTIQITEFNNFKYNLVYPTNDFRIKAGTSIGLLLLVYLAVYIMVQTIMSRWIKFRKKIQTQNKKSLDVTNMNECKVAINDGTETRRYVRIQVIGKDGVGKSSLVRGLVGDSNTHLNSTDGIDIIKKCQIRMTDGEWVIGKVETERMKIIKRLQEGLNKQQKPSESVSVQVITSDEMTNKKEIISSKEPLNEEHHSPTILIDKPSTSENKVTIMNTITSVAEKSNIDKALKDNDVFSTNDIKKSAEFIKIDDMREKIFEQMVEILAKVKVDQNRMTSESLVECGIWDFAGQKDYYATHQTFLNPHAIYLLVTNISEDILSKEDDTNFDSIEEYIDFWFDSIHCLRTNSSGHGLYPPVIVVCTHIDEYRTNKEIEDRGKKYIERFKEVFGNQDKVNHNRGIFFISNTEFDNSDYKKLKDKVSDVAKEMMYFAEELPMRWIELENALSVLKDDSKQNILSWQTCVKLAEMVTIKEKELFPFLTYQHKIGNIIFFADIKEYIILQPDWLVKCFRCLVCDNHELKRNIEIVKLTDWHNLEKTGQLSDNIIDRFFEKEPELEFGKYKTHILNVMEKFDIIVKPKFRASNNDSSLIQYSYYMPCMITTQSASLDIIKKSFGSFSSSPWLILEFEFLPLAYFNHILFYYIKRYTVCEDREGRKTLYRGKALVNLDKTELRKLLICFSKNVIALQVWLLADVEFTRYDIIVKELCEKIEELQRKLSQNISYDVKAKCKKGDYSKTQGRISYKELDEKCVQGSYYCLEHKVTHSRNDAESTWFQYADKEMAKQRKEQTESNPRNSIEKEPTKEEAFAWDQVSVKHNLPVSVNLRKQLNIKRDDQSQNIYSCIKIGNTLLFTDYINKRLIICNADGTDIHYIRLSYSPYDITKVDSNTVAVSCQIKIILIINISTGSVTNEINTSRKCFGISYNDINLYVVIDRRLMYVMDLLCEEKRTLHLPSKHIVDITVDKTCDEKRTIPLPSEHIVDITVDKNRMVIIERQSIYCCSLDGTQIWKTKKDNLKDLHSVTTDDEQNVYVTNCRKHNVLVISNDGEHYRELFTELDELKEPWGIYFDKQDKILLVCNDRDAFLFEVE